MTSLPEGQLFEIQGSKFKSHPGENLGQISAVRITHSMLAFGISKNPLNGFSAQSANLYTTLRFTQLLRRIKVLLSDMRGQDTFTLCIGAAGLPAVPWCAAVDALSVSAHDRVPQPAVLSLSVIKTSLCALPLFFSGFWIGFLTV